MSLIARIVAVMTKPILNDPERFDAFAKRLPRMRLRTSTKAKLITLMGKYLERKKSPYAPAMRLLGVALALAGSGKPRNEKIAAVQELRDEYARRGDAERVAEVNKFIAMMETLAAPSPA